MVDFDFDSVVDSVVDFAQVMDFDSVADSVADFAQVADFDSVVDSVADVAAAVVRWLDVLGLLRPGAALHWHKAAMVWGLLALDYYLALRLC